MHPSCSSLTPHFTTIFKDSVNILFSDIDGGKNKLQSENSGQHFGANK
jgi:hypothetical protein